MKHNENPYARMNGAELMNLYQRGDIEAFNCLYDRYKAMVYGYLNKRMNNRTEVDEVFQNVFLRLHQSRSRYKTKFPFEPWLFAVVRNTLIDYFRKKKKEYNDVPLDESVMSSSAFQVEDKHKPHRLVPENADIKTNQRKAVELRYGSDFSFDEIARSLETTPSNARQLVSRALKKLRKIIKPEDLT